MYDFKYGLQARNLKLPCKPYQKYVQTYSKYSKSVFQQVYVIPTMVCKVIILFEKCFSANYVHFKYDVQRNTILK